MALVKRSEDLVSSSTVQKKKILTEEAYTEEMEKIITRDFFPDLPKLKAQNAYLDAQEKGDVAKLHEIQMAYQITDSTRSRINSVRDPVSTPSGFETPVRGEGSPTRADSVCSSSSESQKKTLDQFLAQSTSEDNASFQVVMEKSDALHRQKYPWLYKDELVEQQRFNDSLALPSTESVEFKKPELLTWKYKNRNSVMYVPDGVDFTPEENLSRKTDQKAIEHGNTRFEAAPFDEQANKEAIAEAAVLQAKMKEGRVGIDGKDIIPGESPRVNGYGFVGTPTPVPGVTDTPIMTWGEIEGTPFRLDGGDTPLRETPGTQQFKIPNLSARERIALSLADKAAKKHRKSEKSGVLSPFMKFGSDSPRTPMEKLQTMSPAAKKLAYAKLGFQKTSDPALRASYSPSPTHTPGAWTPGSTKTPKTPTMVAKSPAVITKSKGEALLNMPKRHKASDFF